MTTTTRNVIILLVAVLLVGIATGWFISPKSEVKTPTHSIEVKRAMISFESYMNIRKLNEIEIKALKQRISIFESLQKKDSTKIKEMKPIFTPMKGREQIVIDSLSNATE